MHAHGADSPASPPPATKKEVKLPPPGCPMHEPSSASSSTAVVPPPTPKPAKLPPPGCPMHEPGATAAPHSSSTAKSGAKACPIDHTSSSDDLSPLNMMPTLGQTPLSAAQTAILSTEREVSTIPRTLTSEEDPTIPKTATHWVYPSAQQFYNALVRKGFETDEEDVDSMVFVHNVLNEVAWKQVLEWEARRKGIPVEQETEAELMRFKGRPGTLSPKARYYLFMGQLFPDSYKYVCPVCCSRDSVISPDLPLLVRLCSTEPPFDRHDWVVRRPSTNSEHRYVIDYYSAPSDPDGSPNFNLDVRPALDDFDAIRLRMKAWVEDTLGGEK